MPEESPFQRSVNEGLNQPEGCSLGGKRKNKGRRKSKPTSSRRSQEQEIKDRYAHAREDAQLHGLIPTTPEEALTSERVLPALDPALPEIIRMALANNWSTPDSAKPAIIASLLEPFFSDDVVLDADGKQTHVKPSRKLLMELAKTLHMLDRSQWERVPICTMGVPGRQAQNIR